MGFTEFVGVLRLAALAQDDSQIKQLLNVRATLFNASTRQTAHRMTASFCVRCVGARRYGCDGGGSDCGVCGGGW
jgi:hypothetical protein